MYPYPVPMKTLARVLGTKIVLTVVLWAAPLLFFPTSLLALFGIPVPDEMAFIRLLGAAYWALIVGYSFGLVEIRRGHHPTGIVWMGIASNGLACVILLWFGATGGFASWPPRGQAFMWLSAALTLTLTAFLYRHRLPAH